jgi:hypothetical protein
VRVDLSKGTVEGRMLNASTKGLKVELPVSLRRGDGVDVHMRGYAPGSQMRVQAEVVWCKRSPTGATWQAGLQLTAYGGHKPYEVLTLVRPPGSPPLDDRQKRRSQRLSCRWPVRCTTGSGMVLLCVARDISRHGILLEVPQAMEPHTGFNLRIEIDDETRAIEAHGVARRVIASGSLWQVASPLLDMSVEDRRLLEAAILRRLGRG